MSEWIFVGPGAVASVVAARLQLRGQTLYAANRKGSSIALQVEGHTRFNGNIKDIRDYPQHITHARWFIAVKAWQLAEVLHQYGRELQQASALVVSHNGLGAAESELAALAPIPRYDYVTTHGSYRKGHAVIHSGLGQSWLGFRQPPPIEENTPPDWLETLDAAMPPVFWDQDITARRWHKLAINCAINALATLADAPNGVILEADYRRQLEGICEEVALIMSQALNQPVTTHTLLAQALEVANKTAENTNSMLQDVRQQQTTEIDYLNGYIEKKGRYFNIPTPFNSALCAAIRALRV